MSTLVVHPGALGDVLILLSLVERLPGPRSLAVRGPALALRGLVPAVGTWIDLEGPLGPSLLALRDPPGDLPGGPYDHAVVLGSAGDRAAGAGLATAVTIGSARPRGGSAARSHLARVLGVAADPPRFPWVEVPATWRGERGGQRVAVHPGSGGRAKRWPVDAFRALARRLEALGREVLWITGPAEEEGGAAPPPGTPWLRSPPIPELARALAGATAYVGCDSGASHLAAALGTPSWLVFGPTDPSVWAPVAPWVAAVRGDPDADGGTWGIDAERLAVATCASDPGGRSATRHS